MSNPKEDSDNNSMTAKLLLNVAGKGKNIVVNLLDYENDETDDLNITS